MIRIDDTVIKVDDIENKSRQYGGIRENLIHDMMIKQMIQTVEVNDADDR